MAPLLPGRGISRWRGVHLPQAVVDRCKPPDGFHGCRPATPSLPGAGIAEPFNGVLGREEVETQTALLLLRGEEWRRGEVGHAATVAVTQDAARGQNGRGSIARAEATASNGG